MLRVSTYIIRIFPSFLVGDGEAGGFEAVLDHVLLVVGVLDALVVALVLLPFVLGLGTLEHLLVVVVVALTVDKGFHLLRAGLGEPH